MIYILLREHNGTEVILRSGYSPYGAVESGDREISIDIDMPDEFNGLNYEYDDVNGLQIRAQPLPLTTDDFDNIVHKRSTEAVNAQDLSKINIEVNQYICERYDIGTQASFNAAYSDEDTHPEVKAAIKSVWNWIKTVLAHYYSVKQAIKSGTILAQAGWDPRQFDATDPKIDLDDFV